MWDLGLDTRTEKNKQTLVEKTDKIQMKMYFR